MLFGVLVERGVGADLLRVVSISSGHHRKWRCHSGDERQRGTSGDHCILLILNPAAQVPARVTSQLGSNPKISVTR